jgi:hypothetical protein
VPLSLAGSPMSSSAEAIWHTSTRHLPSQSDSTLWSPASAHPHCRGTPGPDQSAASLASAPPTATCPPGGPATDGAGGGSPRARRARGAPSRAPSGSCLSVDGPAARPHQSIVHTGRATDQTCDVEIGPRSAVPAVRRSRADEPKLFRADDVEPRRRPRQPAAKTVDGGGRAAGKTLTVDRHSLGSYLHQVAGDGDDGLEHGLYAGRARPGSEVASRACERCSLSAHAGHYPSSPCRACGGLSGTVRAAHLRRDSRAGRAQGPRRGARRPQTRRLHPGVPCSCTPSNTSRATRVRASHEVPRKGCASRLRPWRHWFAPHVR